jgi:hypothetical protein
LSLLKIEPRFLRFPVRNLVTLPTDIPLRITAAYNFRGSVH